MTKLAGVADLAFDCKSATIRMAGAATLEEKVVRAAIEGAGFKTGTFAAQARPMLPVLRVRVVRNANAPGGGGAAAVDATEPLGKAIGSAVSRPLKTDVGADGWVIVRLLDAPLPDLAALKPLLKRELAAIGLELATLETEQWPATADRAVVELRRRVGAKGELATTAALAERLAALPQACAVLPHADGTSFTVFTREPCANLVARAGEQVASLGYEVAANAAKEKSAP